MISADTSPTNQLCSMYTEFSKNLCREHGKLEAVPLRNTICTMECPFPEISEERTQQPQSGEVSKELPYYRDWQYQ